MEFVKGIIPAMVTPLDGQGRVNRRAIFRLTEHLIEGGVHGLFPVGSTGEWYGLDYEQKQDVIEAVIEVAGGRVKIYAGTGAVTTRETVRLTKMAEKAGVDAVSVLTPVFISPNDDQLYEHYRTVADSVRIPVLLYNNPGRTGINLSVELVVRLSNIGNIAGIKDSSGDMTLTAEYIRCTGDDFSVLAGKDTLILSTLVYGGRGSITATANIAPQMPVSIYEAYKKGDIDSAREEQFKLTPLRRAFSLGTFPVIMKEALQLIGIDVGPALKPVGPLTENKRRELKEILAELNLI